MAILETHHAAQNKRPRSQLSLSIAPALASLSRALYRTGLWLVYGGVAAEAIFHADAE